MGIKIPITINQLPRKYHKYPLVETKDGSTQSVYLIGNKYVVKLFENNNHNRKAEQKLLNMLKDIQVSSMVEYFYINKNMCIVYKQISGVSIYNPKKQHIKQIACFLRNMHHRTKDKISLNKKIFNKSYLKDMIIKTRNNILLEEFSHINCKLKNNGVIHGDLFCDNAKFLTNQLNGVFDFSESCNGDFLFDLSVVAISWCYKHNSLKIKKLKVLLSAYGTNISIKEFKHYVHYALVYYATIRVLNNTNYKELLIRLKEL